MRSSNCDPIVVSFRGCNNNKDCHAWEIDIVRHLALDLNNMLTGFCGVQHP